MRRSRQLLRPDSGKIASGLIAAGLLALGGLSPTAAQAASYRMARVSPDRVILIDPVAIWTSPDRKQREAYVITVQRSIVVGDPPVPGYVRTLQQFDCAAGTVNWREFQAFSRSGAMLVKRTNTDAPPAPSTRDFETLAIYRMVCEDNQGDSVVAADSLAKVVIAVMSGWDPPPTVLPLPVAPTAKPAPKPAPKR